MSDWKEAICGVILGIIFIFTVLLVKGMMCSSYGMDYSVILGQCVVRR